MIASAWRIKANPGMLTRASEWRDGEPDADEVAHLVRDGFEIEYAIDAGLLRELVDACTDRQRALDTVTEMKRKSGRNLPRDHYAVDAVRKASARQAHAIERARTYLLRGTK